MMGLASGPVRHFRRPAERPFTAEERGKVTILFGGLTWKHERVIQAVFEGCGYRCEILPVPDVGRSSSARNTATTVSATLRTSLLATLCSTSRACKRGGWRKKRSSTTTSSLPPARV